MEFDEWKAMLSEAGVVDIQSEFDEWTRPEMFWEIRKDRDVNGPSEVFSLSERLRTVLRVVGRFGIRGVRTALESERSSTGP